MVWHISFTKDAKKDLDHLDRQVAVRIVRFLFDKITSLENPRLLGAPLHGPDLKKFWKYRVGDYRIIAQLLDPQKEILIQTIGHRREIYR